MIFTTGAHQSAKFQTFSCSGEISPNLYFDRLLLLKAYKISVKKVQRCYVSWYWKSDAKFEEKPVCCFKSDWILIWALTLSQICTVICPFCAKYITFYEKKYRKVIFNDTEHGRIQRFWKEGALYVGHHGCPTKKILDFRWSKKVKIMSETISFWWNISISIFKFSPFLLIKSYQFFKIY